MDEIAIEPASPSAPLFLRSRPRGISETRDLLSDPISPTQFKTARSEDQNLLPNSPSNVFHYATTTKRDGSELPENIEEGRNLSPLGGIPQTLEKSHRERYADLVVDIFAVGTALPFYALGGALIWANGNVVHHYQGKILHQFVLLAGTMFPLCFSIVVGRAMVKLASWNLERGVSLGSLERLMGSRTVAGTLITQFKMGMFTVIAICLTLLWLLSPIGGQAVLRILSTKDEGTNEFNSTVVYVNTRQASFAGLANFALWFSGFSAQLSASFLAPECVKKQPVDLWNNVKIPRYLCLANATLGAGNFCQVQRSENYSTHYSSLFGIPIAGIPVGNTTFNLESSYMNLDCRNVTSTVAREDDVFIDPGLIGTNGPFRSAQNITSSTSYAMGYLGEDVSTLLPNISAQSLDTLLESTMNTTFTPGTLLYQDFTGRYNVVSIYCLPSQDYVESKVFCTRVSNVSTSDCYVTEQRLSLQPHVSSALTAFSMAETLIGITSLLPTSALDRNSIDILQNYIYKPYENSFIQSAQWPRFEQDLASNHESRFLDLPLSEFGDRLSQIINTFLQGSTMNSSSYLLHFNTAFAASASSSTDLGQQVSSASPLITTPATTSLLAQSTWIISLPFLTLYLLSTTAILISAIASSWLTRNTQCRDYLPYVSNFLRDSQHVYFPSGGVRLDGFERSRIMRKLRIKLGNVGQVEGGWEIGTGVRVRVGRIGIGSQVETAGLQDNEEKNRDSVGFGGRRLYL